MKLNQVKGTAIWRLPGGNQIFTLDGTGGQDSFIIAPFERNGKVLCLKGTVTELTDADALLSSWRISVQGDTSSTSRETYIRWVNLATSEMAAGVLQKAVIARRLWAQGGVSPAEMFSRLLGQHTNAFVYAFMLDDYGAMMGASPETLLRKKGSDLYTEALGGTRTKGRYTEKEMHEHGHIADYVQDILSVSGYNYQRKEKDVRQAGDVQHLLTGFTAGSKGTDKDLALVSALHPTPAVCGLPVDAAGHFISGTENFDRGFYTGFLGPMTARGDFDFFVNLRCAEVYANGLAVYAGAGLNSMSDPQDEWDETSHKMRTILGAYRAD